MNRIVNKITRRVGEKGKDWTVLGEKPARKLLTFKKSVLAIRVGGPEGISVRIASLDNPLFGPIASTKNFIEVFKDINSKEEGAA